MLVRVCVAMRDKMRILPGLVDVAVATGPLCAETPFI